MFATSNVQQLARSKTERHLPAGPSELGSSMSIASAEPDWEVPMSWSMSTVKVSEPKVGTLSGNTSSNGTGIKLDPNVCLESEL